MTLNAAQAKAIVLLTKAFGQQVNDPMGPELALYKAKKAIMETGNVTAILIQREDVILRGGGNV